MVHKRWLTPTPLKLNQPLGCLGYRLNWLRGLAHFHMQMLHFPMIESFGRRSAKIDIPIFRLSFVQHSTLDLIHIWPLTSTQVMKISHMDIFCSILSTIFSPCEILLFDLEGKQYSNNFQEHDCLRYLKVPHFSSLLRSTGEKGGNFKYHKKSCYLKLFLCLSLFQHHT